MGFNYLETAITKLDPLPAVDYSATYDQTEILTKTAITALTSSTPKEKAILQALYTWHSVVINLRQTVYGSSSQYSGNNKVFQQIGATPITDLDVGYRVTPHLKVDVGANNLFDHYPPYQLGNAGGGRVYNVPYGFSPFGINGGFYYGRVTYSF